MAKLPSELAEMASDKDALRLILGFYCILEPERRAEVMALAERYSREAAADNGLASGRTVKLQEAHDRCGVNALK